MLSSPRTCECQLAPPALVCHVEKKEKKEEKKRKKKEEAEEEKTERKKKATRASSEEVCGRSGINRIRGRPRSRSRASHRESSG